MDLAARLTTGRPFPCQEAPGADGPPGQARPPERVLLVALEDPIDRIVLPRLQAAGADVSKVAFVGAVKEDGPNERSSCPLQLPRDLELIEARCTEHRPAL